MKKRHLSLTGKVNILIVVISLGISLSLVMISNRTYRQALLDPYTQKLESVEVEEDVLAPYMEYFLSFMGTEGLREAKASQGTEQDRFIDWMDEQPSYTADDPEYARESLFFDWIAFDVELSDLMEPIEMDRMVAEVVKDKAVYRISLLERGKGKVSDNEHFGLEEPFLSLPPENFSSPAFVNINGEHLLVRCVQIKLDGGEGRIWMIYNMSEAIRQHRGFVASSVLYILILTVAASLVSVLLLRRYVTRPIRKLAQSATEFDAEDDGSYSADRISRVEIRSGDELGDLGREIRSMQERIVENTENLTRLTAEKERIKTELNMAMQIQESMLPSIFPPFPDVEAFDLYATMSAAREVGGDFYDFFLLDEDHLALVMADVSGKGIPAALFMMVTKAILKNNAMMGRSPGEILKMTNETICSNNRMQMFVTVWLGILEISTGTVTAANAGHEYPAIRQNGRFSLYKDRHSFIIGGMSGMRYKEYSFRLGRGDRLFLYTDGVTEAMNSRGDLFGTERMLGALNRHTEGSPREILAGVQSAVSEFADGAEQADDLTMLCLEYNGSGPEKPSL